MKAQLIAEIEAIYRDVGHVRKGRPLEEFPAEQLQNHLDKLKARETPFERPAHWRKKGAGRKKQTPPSPPPSPAGGRGGKRGMIRVKDAEKTMKMAEHVQAFDQHRDGQGILHLCLYDCQNGTVFKEAVRQDREGDYIPPGEIVKDIINFLQKCWETGGMPDFLMMDAAKVCADLYVFLNRLFIQVQLLSPEEMSGCRQLEMAFRTRQSAGKMPAPPVQS